MYRDVVEWSWQVLFQTDGEGRVTFLNRAGATPPASTAGCPSARACWISSPTDRSRVEQHLRSIREGYEDIAQFEFRLRTLRNALRWVEATIRPLPLLVLCSVHC